MRITVLFILTITWHRSGIRTQQCGKPEVTRVPVHIYRRVEEITVRVNRCLFNDTGHAYSDITENCMNAFKTGIFKDKLNRDIRLTDRGSPVVLEEYTTTADLIKNKIKLRSGAICRYDRGFCYDPSETVNYAVVWNVVYKPLQACPTRLELVFSGSVDIWNFQQGHLKYLVYYNEGGDKAFYLKIMKKAHCDKKNILITEGNSFVVSQFELDAYSLSITSLKILPFPLDSKKKVSEAIMKNCDLQQYPLDFTNRIDEDYLKETKNIKTILEYYQELIMRVKLDAEKYVSRPGTGGNSRAWDAILKNLTNLESLVNIKVNEINAINSSLKNLHRVVDGMSKIEDLNETMRIIQELQLEDSRVIKKIDDEHCGALKILEQKFSELDIFVKKDKSNYPTRVEVNEELSNIQSEINSKLQLFINKMDSTLKENFTNLRNEDSKFQRDIANRYDKSLEKLENDFEDLSELLENVRNQLASKINVTDKAIMDNFTLIKNNLAKIEHDLPEIQSLLEKWQNTDNNSVNLGKDLQNQKNNISNIMKLGETYMKNMQTNISSIHLISLNNKYNISEMKNRLEKLLKKLSDIDWNVVKTLKPDSISEEKFQNEISKFQRQYDKNFEELSENLTSALEECKIGWSLKFSNLKTEILDNIDSLLAKTTRNNSENTNELIEGLKRRVYSELTDIKQSSFNNVSMLESEINYIKLDISNITKLILERLNDTNTNMLIKKTELSKCKLDSIEIVKFSEEKLRDIQKNVTNMNNTVLSFGKDISEIREQLTGMKEGLFNVERKLNKKTNEYFESSKKSFDNIVNRTDVQLNMIKQLTFRNLSLMKSEFDSIQQDLLMNHKPILARVEGIDIAVENLQQEFEDHQKNSTSNLEVTKHELKNIGDIVIETKKRSIYNEGEISELKFDLDTITTKLKDIQKTSQEHTLNIKTLNESLKLQDIDISNIFPQLDHFKGVIDEIESKEMNIETKIVDFDEAIHQIDNKLLKYVDVPAEIDKHGTEIDNLKKQAETLETNTMNEAVKNENVFKVIEKNVSDIFTTLKNEGANTSELKTQIKDLFAKFDENKKLIEESEAESMNYVNSRMRSITEEIAQIHNLILKKGQEIRKVEAQISAKSSTCEDTRKDLNDKDALIKQLTVNLDKVMKQVRDNDERIAKINKLIEDNLNGGPDPMIA